MPGHDSKHDDTRLVHLGRHPERHQGVVNTPVYHASTILFPTVEDLRSKPKPLRQGETQYGRAGTPTAFDLEDAVAKLDGGHGAIALPSGLAAIAGTYIGLTKAGDHVLVSDSVYFPNRAFCDGPLRDYGVEVEYYDPLIGAGIADLIRPNTRLIFAESPGSLTFEVQDIPAIAEAAKQRDVVLAVDNTWASPQFCKPLSLGADISVVAATKYIGGHSDLMLGLISVADEALYTRIRYRTQRFGYSAAPDDAYLALRGLRTLSVRLERHQRNALALAEWLSSRPEVAQVLYPALPDHPGHALWKRDFQGASGLFGVVLKPVAEDALARMLNGLEVFGMGCSWGGYESLCIPSDPASARSATAWAAEGPSLRIHAGLEDIGDLIADLEAGFDRMRQS